MPVAEFLLSVPLCPSLLLSVSLLSLSLSLSLPVFLTKEPSIQISRPTRIIQDKLLYFNHLIRDANDICRNLFTATPTIINA
jgi:hypothetical protein